MTKIAVTSRPAISYHRLSPLARAQIQDAGLTVAAYVRAAGWDDGDWRGDRCGCTDDRCVGFHHDELEYCGCLQVFIREVLGWATLPFHEVRDGVACGGDAAPGETLCSRCGWSKPSDYDEWMRQQLERPHGARHVSYAAWSASRAR